MSAVRGKLEKICRLIWVAEVLPSDELTALVNEAMESDDMCENVALYVIMLLADFHESSTLNIMKSNVIEKFLPKARCAPGRTAWLFTHISNLITLRRFNIDISEQRFMPTGKDEIATRSTLIGYLIKLVARGHIQDTTSIYHTDMIGFWDMSTPGVVRVQTLAQKKLNVQMRLSKMRYLMPTNVLELPMGRVVRILPPEIIGLLNIYENTTSLFLMTRIANRQPRNIFFKLAQNLAAFITASVRERQ